MLESKLNILEEILGAYYKSGDSEYLFYCPRCEHHKRKLSINIEKKVFKCWVCEYSGINLYRLVRKYGNFAQRKKWVELAAHGCYHDVFKYTRQQIGECEFYELNYEEAVDRVELMMTEWDLVDHIPRGFRFPGWQCTPDSAKAVSNVFDYLAIHSEINNSIRFGGKAKIFKGDQSIVNTESVQIWNHGLIFQSHIAGESNDNNWNEENYETFRRILESLKKNFELNFLRYEELL